MASNEDTTDHSLSTQRLFEQVYDKHYQAIYAYLFGRVADTEVAQDLLQETFLRVWRHRQRLAEQTKEQQRAWLFTIARNLLTDSYRRHATRSTAEDEFGQSMVVSSGRQKDVEGQIEEKEQMARLDQAIKCLPEDLRMVLVLGVVGEMSSSEIGMVLGKPSGTIRYQMAKARKRLAEALHLLASNFIEKDV